MTDLDIAIVDYQMGNLRSVQKGFEHVGAAATVTSCPDEIARARKIVLPGVGAFGDAITELRQRHLIDPIKDSIQSGKPFLGICLGLQLLFDVGYEGGEQKGLGIFPGEVRRFPASDLKVPHMGWNQVGEVKCQAPLLNGISRQAYFYFVHSYYVVPADRNDVWLNCDYGVQFCAAIWRDNVYATQFHPEKSQRDGIQLLKNFASL
ncbi:MAG: imidazole glycerol phosphate synthase subunit HisH [Planctomycetales bacterium]|nr:imidazole glycerol phosphate synthase subunit HisH [Planctomycetales bacterium]